MFWLINFPKSLAVLLINEWICYKDLIFTECCIRDTDFRRCFLDLVRAYCPQLKVRCNEFVCEAEAKWMELRFGLSVMREKWLRDSVCELNIRGCHSLIYHGKFGPNEAECIGSSKDLVKMSLFGTGKADNLAIIQLFKLKCGKCSINFHCEKSHFGDSGWGIIYNAQESSLVANKGFMTNILNTIKTIPSLKSLSLNANYDRFKLTELVPHLNTKTLECLSLPGSIADASWLRMFPNLKSLTAKRFDEKSITVPLNLRQLQEIRLEDDGWSYSCCALNMESSVHGDLLLSAVLSSPSQFPVKKWTVKGRHDKLAALLLQNHPALETLVCISSFLAQEQDPMQPFLQRVFDSTQALREVRIMCVTQLSPLQLLCKLAESAHCQSLEVFECFFSGRGEVVYSLQSLPTAWEAELRRFACLRSVSMSPPGDDVLLRVVTALSRIPSLEKVVMPRYLSNSMFAAPGDLSVPYELHARSAAMLPILAAYKTQWWNTLCLDYTHDSSAAAEMVPQLLSVMAAQAVPFHLKIGMFASIAPFVAAPLRVARVSLAADDVLTALPCDLLETALCRWTRWQRIDTHLWSFDRKGGVLQIRVPGSCVEYETLQRYIIDVAQSIGKRAPIFAFCLDSTCASGETVTAASVSSMVQAILPLLPRLDEVVLRCPKLDVQLLTFLATNLPLGVRTIDIVWGEMVRPLMRMAAKTLEQQQPAIEKNVEVIALVKKIIERYVNLAYFGVTFRQSEGKPCDSSDFKDSMRLRLKFKIG